MIQDKLNSELKEKQQYKALKRQLQSLIQENELLRYKIQTSENRLASIRNDRDFLLEKLLQYEQLTTSSDSDTSQTADEFEIVRNDDFEETVVYPKAKRLKIESSLQKLPKLIYDKNQIAKINNDVERASTSTESQMTAEEVEKHLQSRTSYLHFVSENAPISLPLDVFNSEADIFK